MKKFFIQLVLELGLIFALFFNVFVSKKMDTTICIAVLLVFLILNSFIRSFRKPITRNQRDVALVIGGLSVVLVGGFYLLGYKTGFGLSYSCIFKNYISFNVWAKIFIIVFLSEIIRYYVLNSDQGKKVYYYILNGLMLIAFFFIEMNISTKVYDLTNFNQLYEFFALVFVQSVAKNIFLNFVTRKYGYKPCLIYRTIMDLNIYFLPLIPKINMFIKGVILLIFPYLVYVVIKYIDDRISEEEKKKENRHYFKRTTVKIYNSVVSFGLTVVFAILVALVSREFHYAMIAIGSESMTGTVNKGDAVIYETYDEKNDKLDVGDIIVYYKDGITIVHRIYKKFTLKGEEVYQTKGDNNENPDNWIVEKNQVVGIYKMRVIYIAWPSVLINEWF